MPTNPIRVRVAVESTRILKAMEPWFEKRGKASSVKARTQAQRDWDSAVLACSEYVRRRTNDNTLALELHSLLTWIDESTIQASVEK